MFVSEQIDVCTKGCGIQRKILGVFSIVTMQLELRGIACLLAYFKVGSLSGLGLTS